MYIVCNTSCAFYDCNLRHTFTYGFCCIMRLVRHGKHFPPTAEIGAQEYNNQLQDDSELPHLLMKISCLPVKASNCNTVSAFYISPADM